MLLFGPSCPGCRSLDVVSTVVFNQRPRNCWVGERPTSRGCFCSQAVLCVDLSPSSPSVRQSVQFFLFARVLVDSKEWLLCVWCYGRSWIEQIQQKHPDVHCLRSFVWNSVSGDPTCGRGDDIFGCQVVQLVHVCQAILRNSQPWSGCGGWWAQKALPQPSPKVDLEIPLEPMAPLGLLWSVLHTPGRLQQSSLCADIPGQSKTRLALLLHLTIPRWVSWIFSSISDWSILGTMSLSTLSSESVRQVSTSR